VLKITQLFLLVVLFFVVSRSSSAGVLIEPVAGFNFGTKMELDNEDYDGSYSGLGGAIGGRLGYQQLGFQLGIDYLRSSIDFDDKDFKNNVSVSEFAGFVGFEFPVLLRVYAGYIFAVSGESKYKDAAGETVDIKFNSGSGAKFGVGFTGLPFIDINLEYRRGTVDEYKIGQTKYEDDEITYSSYLVSLSLPINL